MDKIVQAVAGVHGLSIDEMHGTKRDRHLVDARRQAAVIIKDLLGYASTYIGRYFNKNHATILHHLKANKQIIDYDYIYRDKFILAKNTALDFTQSHLSLMNQPKTNPIIIPNVKNIS